MAKLDENYLDLVRQSLYIKHSKPAITVQKHKRKLQQKAGRNTECPKSTIPEAFKNKLQKEKTKTDPKQVTFLNTSSEKTPENTYLQKSTTSSVKNRIATPFKPDKPSNKLKNKKTIKSPDLSNLNEEKLFSTVSKKFSPSLNEVDHLLFSLTDTREGKTGKLQQNNGKSKKRRLSVSDSPEVEIKRHKEKPNSKKGIQLMFDDSINGNLDTDKKKSAKNLLPDSNGDLDIKQQTLPKKIIHDEGLKRTKHSKKKEKKPLIHSCFDETLRPKIAFPIVTGKTSGNQQSQKHVKKKKTSSKLDEWEEVIDSKCCLDSSMETETEPNLNETWERFISPFKCKKIVKKDNKQAKNKNITKDVRKASSYSNKKLGGDLNKGLDMSVSKNANRKEKKKTNRPKQKTTKTNGSDFTNSLDKVSKLSKIELNTNKRSKTLSSTQIDLEELSDSCDSEIVGVKGLKFQRFCDLFQPTFNEQYVGQSSVLNIPKKHFKITQNDLETDWQTEEISSLKSGKSANKTRPSDVLENNDLATKEASIEKSPIKKLNKRKKDNILDVQIIGVKSTDQKPNNEEVLTNSIPQEDCNESLNKDAIYKSKTVYEPSKASEEKSSNKLEATNEPSIITLKNGSKVVALGFNETIYFHGLYLLKVLNGEIEILGADLTSSSGERKIYSPRGTALLYVKNKSALYLEDSVCLKNLLSEELLNEDDIKITFRKHYAIFLCNELKEPYIDFIEKYISQKIFPESYGPGPRVDFKLQETWNQTRTSEKWDDILENTSEDSRILACGGKGVGKSTFLRYAVNTLLRRFEKVRVIDLDSGQSEFYLPGCLSVVTVTEEIFGPNYTHLLKPEGLVLSHINIGHDIKIYLQSVKHLLQMVKTMEPLPTIINFPGFTQGIGLDISAQSLKLLEPTMVIQINSKNYNKNYRMDLTAENVTGYLEEQNVLGQNELGNHVKLLYNFVKLDSLSVNNQGWSLEGRQSREINILSYFGQMMSENVKDITSCDVNIYSISIFAISILNLEGKALLPLAINSNIVALCSKINGNDDIFSCYGYGFVRGIDVDTDTLVLITPESVNTLENVTHLVLSSVATPPNLIMTANGVKGQIPYVNVGDPIDLGQFTKRSYLPAKK